MKDENNIHTSVNGRIRSSVLVRRALCCATRARNSVSMVTRLSSNFRSCTIGSPSSGGAAIVDCDVVVRGGCQLSSIVFKVNGDEMREERKMVRGRGGRSVVEEVELWKS